ncbi:MAG: hypothetical protein ACFB11_05215 [Paracoccaceae bacterium]
MALIFNFSAAVVVLATVAVALETRPADRDSRIVLASEAFADGLAH